MNSYNYRWYRPQRGFAQSRPFLIVFGIFILAGIPLLVLGMIGPGLGFIGMGLFFYALLIPQAAAVGRKYGIGPDGLRLKSASKVLDTPFGEIEYAVLLTKTESRSFMEKLYQSAVEAERQLDMRRWFKSNLRTAEVVRYLSVSVTGTDMRKGHSTNITSYSVNPDAELLLLKLVSGKVFLISPKGIREFYTDLIQKGISVRPYTAGEE
jgi:hypothetical protein